MTTATEVKERPIIFQGWKVNAILSGATQTRMVVKHPEYHGCTTGDCPHTSQVECDRSLEAWALEECPYGIVGGHLWVRENAWIAPPNFGDERNDPFANCTDNEGRKRVVGYSASMDSDSVRCAKDFGVKQSPSIHMPRWASRLTLEITDVRVERIQDISEEDALAEGIGKTDTGAWRGRPGPHGLFSTWNKASHAFLDVWNSINAQGGYGWDKNPWVWVIAFRRLEAK